MELLFKNYTITTAQFTSSEEDSLNKVSLEERLQKGAQKAELVPADAHKKLRKYKPKA